MSFPVKILNSGVVGIFVVDEEGSANLAAVRVLPVSIEDFFVEVDVVDVDGSVEAECDHLGNLVGLDLAGDPGSVSGAEAVGQGALVGVAVGSPVGVGLHG